MKKQKEQNTAKKKKDFLEALIKANGNISVACKNSNVSRSSVYRWQKAPSFRARLEEAKEEANEAFLDFLEEKLVDRIRVGSDACLIFALKTKAKKRGYVEKEETTNNITNIEVNYDN